MIVVLMGVAGSGKTTVGRLLAQELRQPFYDGDDFHSPASVAKMRQGIALTDADRQGWLAALHDLIARLSQRGESAVIACSALKQAHRDRLLAGQPDTRLVYLRLTPAVARRRVQQRAGHFFNPDLVASQFATLEEPADAIVVEAAAPVAAIVAQIKQALVP